MLPVLSCCHNCLNCHTLPHQGMSLFSRSARRASLFHDLRIGWITESHFLFKQWERQKEWGTEREAGADWRRGRGVTKCERGTTKLPECSLVICLEIFWAPNKPEKDFRRTDTPVFFKYIYIFVRRLLYCSFKTGHPKHCLLWTNTLLLQRNFFVYCSFTVSSWIVF